MNFLDPKLFLFTVLVSGFLSACSAPNDSSTEASNDAANAIVRGRTATGHELAARSVVALVADLEQGQALCTGSIIDEATILTAAHCVENDPSSLTVVFAQDVHHADAKHLRGVVSYVQNPRWKKPGPRGHGDLALIHFQGGLPSGYQPANLASPDISLDEGTSVLMIGYGVTDGLSHAGAGILRLTEAPIMGEASPTEVVTNGSASSVCFGDSGGPAFVAQGRTLVQWGVASSVTSEKCDAEAVHTNIVSYERWIKAAAERLAADDSDDSDDDDDEATPAPSYVEPQSEDDDLPSTAAPLEAPSRSAWGGDLTLGFDNDRFGSGTLNLRTPHRHAIQLFWPESEAQ